MLLQAGVCMRVPFNRVTVKRAVESTEPNDMLDFAGVSLVQECLCKNIIRKHVDPQFFMSNTVCTVIQYFKQKFENKKQ